MQALRKKLKKVEIDLAETAHSNAKQLVAISLEMLGLGDRVFHCPLFASGMGYLQSLRVLPANLSGTAHKRHLTRSMPIFVSKVAAVNSLLPCFYTLASLSIYLAASS